jgi:hypothetical protein
MIGGRRLAAVRLLQDAQVRVRFARLLRLKEVLAPISTTIATTPPGAEIYLSDYSTDDAPWLSGAFALAGPGHTRRVLSNSCDQAGICPNREAMSLAGGLQFQLHTLEETPADMVWVPGIPEVGRPNELSRDRRRRYSGLLAGLKVQK